MFHSEPHAGLSSDDAIINQIGHVNFGTDWSVEHKDREQVIIDNPRCPLNADQVRYLATTINPMQDSPNHAMDLYMRALNIVSSVVS
jgi:hypothetical protein